MSASAGMRATVMAAVILAVVGCTQPGGHAAVPSASPSTSSADCTLPPGAAWAMHADAVGGFSVTYPPGFTFELQRYQPSGVEESYRAVETCYLKVPPQGQLEVTVYLKDANSLEGWINKHTGDPAFTSPNQYFSAVTHEAPARVTGHDAMAFDWQPDATPHTVHNTAMFLGTQYVLVVGWWADDAPGLDNPGARAAYAAALQADYKHMLADLRLG